jgi:hypothetical protein
MSDDAGEGSDLATSSNHDHDRHAAKVRATFQLPVDLLDELRNAVVALSGPPHRLTLAKVAENALRSELERLKELQSGRQRGKSFPQREAEVRTGRPIGG